MCLFCVSLICRKQALAAKIEAEKEGIVVPMTLEDYCIKPKAKPSNQDPPVNIDPLKINLYCEYYENGKCIDSST